ncbi:efflux RND transporter periplasmic adaptor subunit [Metabacillus indicus]|uniref:RND efflux pump membrane fusion protein barrel-sandwich domain-containing protein n=1 Tax=Metabacillus indicus TaxID=246786 RepID=A0A084GZT7_METID|nr:biotin/lipoyl-binding protein [Metabacillus indicus]KEZ52849.1 hypothetical protein GS18_0208420 [Metabacillus indicus]
MKKQAMIGIISLAVLFIAVNIAVIFTSDKIERSKSISQFTKAETGELQKLLFTKGVVVPASDYKVMYSKDLGTLREVLVSKGDAVVTGDPLITYETGHLDAEIEELQAQNADLQSRISSAESDLSDLQDDLDEASVPVEVEEGVYLDDSAGQKAISSQIGNKQDQIAYLNQQIDSNEQKAARLQAQKEAYNVTSKMDGIVTAVNPFPQNPEDPMIVIQSSEPFLIEGKLSEKEAVLVKEGQKATAEAEALANSEKEAIIREVTMTPIDKPSVDQSETYYPFLAELIEPSENWHHGFHVGLDIVLEERSGVIVIDDTVMKKQKSSQYIYVLKKGKLEKRKLDVGLKINSRNEVLQGLEKGERIVTNPSPDLKNNMKVFIPMNHHYLEKKTLKSFTNEQKIRLIISGMVK